LKTIALEGQNGLAPLLGLGVSVETGGDSMEVLNRPANEKEVLRPTKAEASKEDVIKSMSVHSECCVVHLCGCGTGPGGNGVPS
jgi:hypothetical protein